MFSSFTPKGFGCHNAMVNLLKWIVNPPIAIYFQEVYIRAMDVQTQIQALKETDRRRKLAVQMQLAGKSLKEIGHVLGVSRERARQIIAKAQKEPTA